jgi:type I restriction enzyme M protein
MKELAKAEKAAARNPSAKRKPPPLAGGGTGEGDCLQTARDSLQPVLEQIAALESTLAPYEQIKRDLAAARARFRKLTDEFVSELKNRCGFMGEDKKRELVLELFAQDVQSGFDNAVGEKRQGLVRFVEALWDKYRVTLTDLLCERRSVEAQLEHFMDALAYR